MVACRRQLLKPGSRPVVLHDDREWLGVLLLVEGLGSVMVASVHLDPAGSFTHKKNVMTAMEAAAAAQQVDPAFAMGDFNCEA